MSLDLPFFADKVRRCREMFGETAETLSETTGISLELILAMESAERTPTGDEVLILADHYLQDFKFFISNEQLTPLERTEKLFRAYSEELSSDDRWAIQEFIYLCETEAFLVELLQRQKPVPFSYVPRGTYYIGHGQDAARSLREALGYEAKHVCDVFHDLRRIGVHVFRRSLANPKISGLFLNHPTVGPCVLVNYSEDVNRQRFTAAHEAAHTIFDCSEDYVVSFTTWGKKDLHEIRANSFAGSFLVPPELVKAITSNEWTEDKLLHTADQLKVNVQVLLKALVRDNRMSKDEASQFENVRISRSAKEDPELPDSLTETVKARKLALLQRGISSYYAELCFEAFQKKVISAAKLSEALLVQESELRELASLYRVRGI